MSFTKAITTVTLLLTLATACDSPASSASPPSMPVKSELTPDAEKANSTASVRTLLRPSQRVVGPAPGIVERGAALSVGVLTPSRETVEHRSTVRIEGRVFTFLKIRHASGRLEERVLEGRTRIAPGTVRKLMQESVRRFGKIHPDLARQLGGLPRVHPVRLWLELPETERVEKPGRSPDLRATLAQLERSNRARLARFGNRKDLALRSLGLRRQELIADLRGTPFLQVALSPDRIRILATLPAVRMLLLDEQKAIVDLAGSMAISGADDVQNGGTIGNGAKVGVWEGAPAASSAAGVIPIIVNSLVVTGSYSAWAGFVPITFGPNANHALNTSGIVQGYAPGAAFFSADSSSLAALDWAIDTSLVNALNQSFHRGAEINDGISSDDLYKDYKILHYPWPFISQAAGNWCAVGTGCYEAGADVTDEFVNHKGFNSISVGNHNDAGNAMSASSCFINPTGPKGDRELPELSANGTFTTAQTIQMSGTSMASPAVVGSAGLLMEIAPILRIWPEGIRALLFAGAMRNVPTHLGNLAGGGAASNASGTWWQDVAAGKDAFDGAGSLEIDRSVQIAGSRTDGTASAQGWDIGTMHNDDFSSEGFYRDNYQILVPGTGTEKRPVRVALAWNSHATVDRTSADDIYNSVLELDLDIRIYDELGNQVAFSLSWDNSYEVADFPGEQGKVYTVKIHRWSTATAQSWSWFGIAWNTQ